MSSSYHTCCLSCGATELSPLKEEYAHAFLVKCRNCGLVFSRKIPTNEELQLHYATYTRDNSISPLTITRYEELLEKFEPYRKSGRILDIGCGDGHFLAVAKKKGWHVTGTEFTDEAVTVCRAKGIEIHQGRLQEFSGEPFDVITSFEVLEHLNDGKAHLHKIHALLLEGGLFYFTTPNFNSLSRKILGGKWNVIEYPEHLTYYTARTVQQSLKEAGFRKRSLHTTGFSPQRFKSSSGTGPSNGNSDEALRNSIEKRFFLRVAKKTINGLLSFFNSGDTLKGFFIRK